MGAARVRQSGMRLGTAAMCALAALVSASPASALDKHACVVASDQGQALRLDGKLVLAHARFVECADVTCPALVRTACADWLNDLDKQVPSVILSVRDADRRDIVDARVLLDGAELTGALEGRPVLVDPGPHSLRFVAPGASPVEQAVVIREGEQRRVIDVVLNKESALAAVSPSPPPSLPPKASSGRTAAWAFAIGAGAAWTAFGIFAVIGHVDYENEKGSCGPNCGSGSYSSINTKFDVADVSLGVAIALTGVATVLFLTHSGTPSSRATARPGLQLSF
jgi:hypothetical protein